MSQYARRLQKIGSSMLISLPSQWVQSNNLRKGNTLLLEVNRDNSISLFSSEVSNEDTKEVTIQYLPLSIDSLINQIYGAYLLGYNNIRIYGKSSITFEDRELITRVMRKLVGIEIVDEDSSNIFSQFLLDPNALDAEKILRRMNSIVAGMYRDTINGLFKNGGEVNRSIDSRDDEVDRQYFLLVRLIRTAMIDQALARKLNLTNIDILDYRIAANHLESAGDYITDFSSALLNFPGTRFIDEITEASWLIEKMQEKSVAAFTSKNRLESIEVARIYGKFDKLMKSAKDQSARKDTKNLESTIAILNSIYSMEKIAKCWVDVSDLVKPLYSIPHAHKTKAYDRQ